MSATATFENDQIVLRSCDSGEVFAATIAPPDALSWRGPARPGDLAAGCRPADDRQLDRRRSVSLQIKRT